jgi:type IV secretory pathway VirB6-like protein
MPSSWIRQLPSIAFIPALLLAFLILTFAGNAPGLTLSDKMKRVGCATGDPEMRGARMMSTGASDEQVSGAAT